MTKAGITRQNRSPGSYTGYEIIETGGDKGGGAYLETVIILLKIIILLSLSLSLSLSCTKYCNNNNHTVIHTALFPSLTLPGDLQRKRTPSDNGNPALDSRKERYHR